MNKGETNILMKVKILMKIIIDNNLSHTEIHEIIPTLFTRARLSGIKHMILIDTCSHGLWTFQMRKAFCKLTYNFANLHLSYSMLRSNQFAAGARWNAHVKCHDGKS